MFFCYLMGIEASACAKLLLCFALLCFNPNYMPLRYVNYKYITTRVYK